MRCKYKHGLCGSGAFLLDLHVVLVWPMFSSHASLGWPSYSLALTHCPWLTEEGIVLLLGLIVCAFHVLVLIQPLLVNLYSRHPCSSSVRKDFQNDSNIWSKTLILFSTFWL